MVKVKFDEDKKEWVECGKDEGLYLDGFLKQKLDNIKMILKKNWDAVIVIVGDEGSGKSTLSFVIAQYLTDMKLTMDNLSEGSADAIEKLERMPNGSLLICDEAELLFSSRETMSKEQRQLTQVMKIIRQKNMTLILVSPVFFDLSKYIAVDRSRFLLRTYTDSNLNRGSFAYWGKKKKIRLYQEGKKHYGSYGRPKPNFSGKFTNYILPFDDEYQKLKARSLTEAFKNKTKEAISHMEKLQNEVTDAAALKFMKKFPEKSFVEVASTFDLTPAHVRYLKTKQKVD
jgi:ABC-type dipeptide/oligopeptide/nickel transport system ATPase component